MIIAYWTSPHNQYTKCLANMFKDLGIQIAIKSRGNWWENQKIKPRPSISP